MIDWLLKFEFTGMMGIYMYWGPLGLCLYGYTVRTFIRYQQCADARDAGKHFVSDTVGTLVGRALATVVPGVNMLAATFDIGPMVFARFFKAIGKMFDFPLVAKRNASSDD
jgi:hypothetical protein